MSPDAWRTFLRSLPGGLSLSDSFCNLPVRVDSSLAAVLVCGRTAGHGDECAPETFHP